MTWLQQVENYLDRLEEVTQTLSDHVGRTQIDSRELRVDEIETATLAMAETLRELEQRVARREELLADTQAPIQGATLIEKLSHLRDARSEEVGKRCESVSARIAETNHQAVSLFVCQFHLAGMSGDIVRILAGASSPETYGDSEGTLPGGNLFNESA